MRTWLAFVVVAAVTAATLVATVRKTRHVQGGEAGARVWFYDQKAQRLYSAPRDLIPPDGSDDSKVSAIVVGFQGMGNDVSQLKIAYLQKYGPDLKSLLERAEAAHAARKPFAETIPSASSDEFKSHSFVKTPEESNWHTLGSEEGRRIVLAWREWRGPSGQMPVISVPQME